MNERKIETQVYKHFDNQLENFGLIEEQMSDNPRISELLKGASKNGGNGIGRPEHIITFKTHYDLLIITECKGDKKLHSSTINDLNPKKYAEDGVKHYSKFLSSIFNYIDNFEISRNFRKSFPQKLVRAISISMEEQENIEEIYHSMVTLLSFISILADLSTSNLVTSR
jgi:hypothetical protein